MKGASLGYLTREGFRNIWVNRLLSLATIVVLISCLIIVGSGSLIFLNINAVLDLIEGQNVVMVYVNDELLEEDYIKGKTVLPVQKDNLGIVRGYYGELAEIFADPSYSRSNPIKLGEGEVFAMGDNRENSSDSRNLGIFTEDEIMGHAVFRFWPFNKIEMLD